MSETGNRRLVDRLSRNRKAGLRSVRSGLRSFVRDQPPPEPRPKTPKAAKDEAPASATRRRLPKAEPAPPLEEWPTAPGQTSLAGRVTPAVEPEKVRRFDADLFEQLNEEYRSKPIVKRDKAPTYDRDSLVVNAKKRVRWVHNTIDLRGKRVLEIGCGSGFETWYAGNVLAEYAHGVDITEWTSWPDLRGERCGFTEGDLAQHNPFEPGSFDRIMSFTVWEHVWSPYHLLKAAYDVLEPGGLFFLRANLYPGVKASHRYRDIYFPWPHLLFDDATIQEWDARHGRTTGGAAWVNRLSWAHYEDHFARVGFELVNATFDKTPIDEEFYARFEDILARYPRWDLETDYFRAILAKPLDAT
jgi:SAM-dependent methyltransferase